MFKKIAGALALVALLAVPSAAGAAPASTDAIWITSADGQALAASGTPQLRYGDQFRAGYRTKAAQPWGLAECWAKASTVLGTPNQGSYKPGDVIWSGYRSLYSGGPIAGAFELTDPINHLWLGGGATCRLSLLKLSRNGRQTVLGTPPFDGAG